MHCSTQEPQLEQPVTECAAVRHPEHVTLLFEAFERLRGLMELWATKLASHASTSGSSSITIGVFTHGTV